MTSERPSGCRPSTRREPPSSECPGSQVGLSPAERSSGRQDGSCRPALPHSSDTTVSTGKSTAPAGGNLSRLGRRVCRRHAVGGSQSAALVARRRSVRFSDPRRQAPERQAGAASALVAPGRRCPARLPFVVRGLGGRAYGPPARCHGGSACSLWRRTRSRRPTRVQTCSSVAAGSWAIGPQRRVPRCGLVAGPVPRGKSVPIAHQRSSGGPAVQSRKEEHVRIFEYAKVADWESRLQTLVAMAEQERWTYSSVPSTSPVPVLDAFVRFTFIRVHEQQRIAEVDKLACFNTGLLTPSQEEIFGVFRLSDRYDPTSPESKANKKWFLTKWARSGERVLTDFPELPRLASYWTSPSELIFDPQLQVQPNLDHIIRDNLNRFPVELGGFLGTDGVPQDVDTVPDIEAEASVPVGIDESEADEPETTVPLATRNALEGAIKHSIRLAQRSYRVAVPQYYRGRIQLMLPLYLRESGNPDLALTLERHGDWYRAATVLYPDWAYRHARLLSRPNSEWLGGFRTDVVPL